MSRQPYDFVKFDRMEALQSDAALGVWLLSPNEQQELATLKQYFATSAALAAMKGNDDDKNI